MTKIAKPTAKIQPNNVGRNSVRPIASAMASMTMLMIRKTHSR